MLIIHNFADMQLFTIPDIWQSAVANLVRISAPRATFYSWYWATDRQKPQMTYFHLTTPHPLPSAVSWGESPSMLAALLLSELPEATPHQMEFVWFIYSLAFLHTCPGIPSTFHHHGCLLTLAPTTTEGATQNIFSSFFFFIFYLPSLKIWLELIPLT